MSKRKHIKADKYKNLKKGQIYLFDSIRIKEVKGEPAQISYTEPEEGRLINITTKKRELLVNDKPSGKFETVGDIVVYEPIDNYIDWKGEKLRVYSRVIGCNMFRVYEA